MGIAPLRLMRSLGAADVAHTLLLHVAGVALLRLLLWVDLVSLVDLSVVVRVQVLRPGVSSTAPRRSCAPCDSPLTGD